MLFPVFCTRLHRTITYWQKMAVYDKYSGHDILIKVAGCFEHDNSPLLCLIFRMALT